MQEHKTEIPEGFIVSHKCNNRACVNPDHLELATSKENTQYMLLSNRWVRYEDKKPRRPMTLEEKLSCVVLHLSGASFYRIAKKHNRRFQHVQNVVRNYLKNHSQDLIGILEAAQKQLQQVA